MAAVSTPTDFISLVGFFLDLINPLLVVVAGIAVLVFFKGLLMFISKAGDAKNHKDGRNLMVWGILALFVMVSVIGIVRMVHEDLGFGAFGLPKLPTNPSSGTLR